MMRPSTIALGGLSLALFGCAQAAHTYSPSDNQVQISGYYSDGAADRDLRLEVIGNPFPSMPDTTFHQAVEAALRSQAVLGRAPTNFMLAPGPTAKPLYRLVYAFGQPNVVYGNVLCQIDPNRPWPVAPSGTVTASAAFCVGGEAESFISGDVQAATPNDPGFVQLAQQLMDGVFRPDFQVRAPANVNGVRVP
jgi:hypothetical protein